MEERRSSLFDDDDDLEYHITFPTPSRNFSESEFVFVPSNEPVIFLLGWGGCLDKHLSKYSQVYTDNGCITIRYTAPVEYVFFAPEKIRPLARKLLDLIEEMSLDRNPIFIHAFSNNGSSVYQYMNQLMVECPEYSAIKNRFRGRIFDSAPGRRTFRSFLQASSMVYEDYFTFPGGKIFLSVLLMLLMHFLGLCKLVFSLLTGKKRELLWYEYLLQDEIEAIPYLFVYSKGDEIVPFDEVEFVIGEKEKQKCDVTKLRFDDSPHVQHLRFHRESYSTNIVGFINKCISEKKKKKK